MGLSSLWFLVAELHSTPARSLLRSENISIFLLVLKEFDLWADLAALDFLLEECFLIGDLTLALRLLLIDRALPLPLAELLSIPMADLFLIPWTDFYDLFSDLGFLLLTDGSVFFLGPSALAVEAPPFLALYEGIFFLPTSSAVTSIFLLWTSLPVLLSVLTDLCPPLFTGCLVSSLIAFLLSPWTYI